MPPRKKRVKPSRNVEIASHTDPTGAFGRKQLNSNSIHRLPNELLQEIFLTHVWTNFDTPVRLILVCKLWNSVGSLPALWGNIFYDNGFWWRQLENEEDLSYRVDGMVYCSDQDSLNRAIARTGSSKFELTICRNGGPHLVPDMFDATAFSTRCRLLRFIDWDALYDFRPWIKKVRLAALEQFLCLGTYNLHPEFHPDLAGDLQKGSPLLWNLSTLTSENVRQYRPLFQQLKKLSVGSFRTIFDNPLEYFTIFSNLEELVICGDGHWYRSAPPENSILMPSLRRVSLAKASLGMLPKELYGQLTHLTLKCFRGWTFGCYEGIISLPHLIYLSVNGSWRDAMHLDAPKLVTLILRDGTEKNTLDHLDKFSFSPEILHIDKILSQKDLTRILRRSGKNLKELYITHVKRNDTITETLVSNLIGNKSQSEMCPLLQRLDILTVRLGSPALQETTHARLRRFIAARKPMGYLQQVRHGWYPPPKQSSEALEFASRKWWTVEWKELLSL